MPAEYVIYRKDVITDDESTVQQPVLVRVGDATGNHARQALLNWYIATGETEMGDYMVIPLSHHHALSPRAPQTRLVFE